MTKYGSVRSDGKRLVYIGYGLVNILIRVIFVCRLFEVNLKRCPNQFIFRPHIRGHRCFWHIIIPEILGKIDGSGLGRGLFDVVMLNAVHDKMNKMLAAVGGRIDAVFSCPHTTDDKCRCRKPGPGLFEQIGERYGVDLGDVPMAGDAVRDLIAGATAGCEPHLVLTGKGAAYRNRPLSDTFPAATRVHADLAAFADFLIARETMGASA